MTLMVLDLFGKNVATLIDNENMQAGKHVGRFPPEKHELPNGMYHYTLVTNKKTLTKKMVYCR